MVGRWMVMRELNRQKDKHLNRDYLDTFAISFTTLVDRDFSLNQDGSLEATQGLTTRTAAREKVEDFFHNAHIAKELKKAAEKTTPEDPFIKLKEQEHVYAWLRGELNSRMTGRAVNASAAEPRYMVNYKLALVCEKDPGPSHGSMGWKMLKKGKVGEAIKYWRKKKAVPGKAWSNPHLVAIPEPALNYLHRDSEADALSELKFDPSHVRLRKDVLTRMVQMYSEGSDYADLSRKITSQIAELDAEADKEKIEELKAELEHADKPAPYLGEQRIVVAAGEQSFLKAAEGDITIFTDPPSAHSTRSQEVAKFNFCHQEPTDAVTALVKLYRAGRINDRQYEEAFEALRHHNHSQAAFLTELRDTIAADFEKLDGPAKTVAATQKSVEGIEIETDLENA